MKIFDKFKEAMGIKPKMAEDAPPPEKEERMPTGNSKYTPKTDTPERKQKRKRQKLQNAARNKQRTYS